MLEPRRTGRAPARKGRTRSRIRIAVPATDRYLTARMTMFLVVGGALLVVLGVSDARSLIDAASRPAVRMTVDSCHPVEHRRSTTTTCYGHGDPAAPTSPLTVPGGPHPYAPGEVLTVRCTRAGSCDTGGRGALATALGENTLGLLLLVLGLVDVARTLTARYAPASAGLFERRSTRRVLAAFVVPAALLLIASLVLAALP